jgi:uncharacterized membrane protein
MNILYSGISFFITITAMGLYAAARIDFSTTIALSFLVVALLSVAFAVLVRRIRICLVPVFLFFITHIEKKYDLGGIGQWYPVIVSGCFFTLFLRSLYSPTSIIERFALSYKGSLSEYERTYCRNVTKIWIGFFAVNSIVSSGTILLGNPFLWFLYNGVISYCIMGFLFGSEFTWRYFLKNRRAHSAGDNT